MKLGLASSQVFCSNLGYELYLNMQGLKNEKLSNKHFSYPLHFYYYANDIFGVTKRSKKIASHFQKTTYQINRNTENSNVLNFNNGI